MSDEDYPDPKSKFGISVKKDITYIKEQLDQLLEKQEEHTAKLQNGLTSKVNKALRKLDEIEGDKETEEEREHKEDVREDERRENFWTQFFLMLLSNLIGISGALFLAWLSFA